MKNPVFAFAFSCTLGAACLAGQPEIEVLTVAQSPSRLITIDYRLSEDAIVAIDLLTNHVSIGAENFRTLREPSVSKTVFPGNRVTRSGTHRLEWRPNREWPDVAIGDRGFSVGLKAWSLSQPPDYMVVDLTTKSNVCFYASADELPDGGIKTADPSDAAAVADLTNDVYRTTKLVMRRVHATGIKWCMGSPSGETGRSSNETAHFVTLTNDYFVSIYQLTEAQYRYVTGATPNKSVLPAYFYTYRDGRGSVDDYCWPSDGHAVSSTSTFGMARILTGLEFDMPTEAQWEFACRAGTTGCWCDNGSSANAVAWYIDNLSKSRTTVGIKNPNAWGIYDMHGLLQEWVLDQYAAEYGTASVIEPVGATDNANNRIVRGGSCWQGQNATRSAARRSRPATANSDSDYGGGFGFRMCCPAIIPVW